MIANEIAIPAATAKGPALCSFTDDPIMMGNRGSTQGESVDNTPAAKPIA